MVLNTLRQQPNEVNTAFFSNENLQRLQKDLQDAVRSEANVTIDRQNDRDLLVVMRSVYTTTLLNHNNQLQDQLTYLNNAVLKLVVPQVLSGVQSHKQYLKDISTPLQPMSRAIQTSSKGENVIELPIGLL